MKHTVCVHPSILFSTKSLPWILSCKTGQPNSFGYEFRGSLQAHTEALTACLTCASSPGGWRTKGHHACTELIWALRGLSLGKYTDNYISGI